MMRLRILYTRAEALRILRKMPWQQRKAIKELAAIFTKTLPPFPSKP
jgi:hypothetical protein